MTVLEAASAAAALAPSALPPLKPSQPNQRRPAPRRTKGTLWGSGACFLSFANGPKGKRKVVVTPEVADPKEYLVAKGRPLAVNERDFVRAGEALLEGPSNPHDILRVKGEPELAKYLLNEVQGVYRLQGVKINDTLQVSTSSQTPLDGPHTVPAGATPSGGQYMLAPSQVSAASQLPSVMPRHGVPLGFAGDGGQSGVVPVQWEFSPQGSTWTLQSCVGGAKPSGGHNLLTPLQKSGASQSLTAFRHTRVVGATASGHTGDEPSQKSSASQATAEPPQAVPGGFGALASQNALPPAQNASYSHGPLAARQSALDTLNSSSGHALSSPVHVSSMSHSPPMGRQTSPAGASASAGHSGLAPVQYSGESQSPLDERQIISQTTSPSSGHSALRPSQASSTSHPPF